jgi:hypothetical protein|eukprot:COSAG06_NODE_1550_length_9129_cov_4.644408_11_plen_178_part_00
MAGPDDGASSRKRKRAKKTRGPAAAATSAATPVALGETAQGLQLRHRPFVLGADRPAPPTRLQLSGLDDEQRSAALAALEEFGLVHLTDVALPSDFLAALRSRASALSEQVEEALARRGIQYQHGSAHSSAARAVEHDQSFKFKEVASRCLGRLDIRHGMQTGAFADDLLTHNPRWR